MSGSHYNAYASRRTVRYEKSSELNVAAQGWTLVDKQSITPIGGKWQEHPLASVGVCFLDGDLRIG